MHELLHDDGFQIALVVGLALSGGVALLHRRPRLVWLGFEAGAAAAIAALVALFVTHHRAMLSLLGLVLVVLGAIVGRWLRSSAFLTVVPGAALIALALHAPVPDWAAVTCFAAIAVTVPCAVAIDRAAPRVLPILLATTAVGMWGTTPDTEHTRIMVGALVGVVVLVLDRHLGTGAGGTAAVVALMVWASTVDGFPRESAVIGALGCFGAVVLLPLVGGARIKFAVVPVVTVSVVQAGIVVASSRAAGLRASATSALLIVAGAWIVATVVLVGALPMTQSDRGHRT